MISIFTPATTANLGSGFDVLGAALDFGNELEVRPGHPFSISIAGEGSTTLPRGTGSLIYRAYTRVFELSGEEPIEAAFVCRNRIPLSRGLGSSAAAAAAGALAACLVRGSEDVERALAVALELEGHPDNVIPCFRGGIQLCYATDDGWESVSLPVPEGVALALVVPRQRLSTSAARKALGSRVTLAQATFNMARVGLLVHALESGKLELLKEATRDAIHQGKRLALISHGSAVLDRLARDERCLAAWLSGAGSTLAFLVKERDIQAFCGEAADVCRAEGLDARVFEARFSPKGVSVLNNG